MYNPSVTENLCGDYKLTNLQLTGISRFQRTSPSLPMPAPPPGWQSEVVHGTVTSTFSLDSFTFKLGVMVLSRSLFFRPVSQMFSRDRSVNMSLEGEERGKCLPSLKKGRFKDQHQGTKDSSHMEQGCQLWGHRGGTPICWQT